MQINWLNIWRKIRKYVLNKYILTCCVFALVLTFCGEQSLVNRTRRAHQISELESEIDSYRQLLEQTKEKIVSLEGGQQQLERYARERYLMHADNEDVFIIAEDN